jgi:peptidoglycan L-alanyl-D-glutamate endopeptidase CwlK
MSFELTARDRQRLTGVHPDLVAVVERAAEICPKRFMVVEGCRTLEQQKRNVAKGVSKTLKSRHIPTADGFDHAVDLLIAETGTDKDWSDANPNWRIIETAMKSAAGGLGTPIEWGGDWKSFVDTPHWQLPWGAYPGSKPLGKSRTVAGAASAGGFGLLADPVSQAAQQIQPLADYSQVIKWVFVALMVAGAALAIYARYDDARKGGG